ncbi:MAG: hypothetical protein ACRBF0_10275 [Calditrichia bacterium]
MKIVCYLIVCLLGLFSMVNAQENEMYELTIGGNKFDVELGKSYTFNLPSGESIQVSVQQKAVTAYSDDFLSFQHPPESIPSHSNVHNDLAHVQLVTQLGTYYLIQEHSAFNELDTERLIQIILKKINAKEIGKGYTIQQIPFTRAISDSVTFEGVFATVSTPNDPGYECVVATYGSGTEGIVVVTRIQKAFSKTDQPILDMLWNTLRVKK